MNVQAMQRRTFLKAGALAGAALLTRDSARLARAAATARPSILFCSPKGLVGGWIDLEYLRELHTQGFEVDYTNSLAELTWDRIRPYNVLVLYVTPDSWAVNPNVGLNQPSSPARIRSFVTLIEHYLAAGGGVFLMPMEENWRKQMLSDLTDRWGAKLPGETIVETNPVNQTNLVHASYPVPLAYTDQVLPSPVSQGVTGIWYPIEPRYNAAMGGPIIVDKHWHVVLRASPSAYTKPVRNAGEAQGKMNLPPGLFISASPVKAPPLFAIRPYSQRAGQGRIALVNQWPQFSVGSGVKWIFDRQVLSRGSGGKPSAFGRLLENTWRWLAEPSLKSKAVGGYVTGARTLVAPNLLPAARKPYEYGQTYWRDKLARWQAPPRFAPVYRGLVGAKTIHSSGHSTVAEYAAAAKEAGLQFIVFLDDFDKLTREKWARLKADCKRFSDEAITLLPGYSIDANTGDHMFFYGPVEADNDPWPPAEILTGPGQALLNLQPQNKSGAYTGYNGPSFDWILYSWVGPHGNHGFYHFSGSPHLMRIADLRAYGTAAIRYYQNGKLIEDNTADYLTTAAGTIPPAPISFNEVRSTAELSRELQRGHALTYVGAPWYVQKPSVSRIFQYGLKWPNQYVSYNTFFSDGPIIHAWPETYRVWTLGAEEFVTLPNIMVSRLQISAAAGLKEITLYNGPELFRRFQPGGAKQFSETLLLDATIQRNLVLIATDEKGGKAVSFARRSWKDGARAPVFCGDHVNDCRSDGPLLAHGPFPMMSTWVQPLPVQIAGDTWDGGPPAVAPLATFQESRPDLDTDRGQEIGSRFENTPLLDYSDEGSVAVASRQDRVFSSDVLAVVNPWDTFGPLAGPSRLMEFTLRHWEYCDPTVGVPQTGWAAPGVREGVNVSLFRSDIRFKQAFTIKRLTLLQNNYWMPPAVQQAQLLIGKAPATVRQLVRYRGVKPSQSGPSDSFRLEPGDWFALYSPDTACSHLFIVRGQPIQLQVSYPQINISAEIAGKPVQAGDTCHFELFSLGVPVNMGLQTSAQVTRLLSYLNEPTGLKVLRGRRAPSPGFIECQPHAGAVEVLVPKPTWKTNLTLPLRVQGLNRRWSAGLFQRTGYVLGNYGAGDNRYRALGIDGFGYAYVPMYVDRAHETHLVAGHPIIADAAGQDLFIGVMHLYDAAAHQPTTAIHPLGNAVVQPPQWQVSVNNPTDQPVTCTLRKAMDLPGLVFPNTKLTLAPGEYRVLTQRATP